MLALVRGIRHAVARFSCVTVVMQCSSLVKNLLSSPGAPNVSTASDMKLLATDSDEYLSVCDFWRLWQRLQDQT